MDKLPAGVTQASVEEEIGYTEFQWENIRAVVEVIWEEMSDIERAQHALENSDTYRTYLRGCRYRQAMEEYQRDYPELFKPD